MKLQDCFELGEIVKPHGIKGELQAFFDVDHPEYYGDIDALFLQINGQLVPHILEYIKMSGSKVILKLEEINSREDAEKLRRTKLFLPDDLLPTLEKGQFYYHEIIGYKVKDEKLGDLGTVTTIFTQGVQDLLEMNYQGREMLIPVIDDIVKSADHSQKELYVSLPEGLIDIYLQE